MLVPYSPLILLDISPIDFKGQMFWEMIVLLQVPRVKMPDMGHKPLLLREKLYICNILSGCGSQHRGREGVRFLVRPHLYFPYLDMAFLSSAAEELFS